MPILRLPPIATRGALAVALVVGSAACTRTPPSAHPSAAVTSREVFVRALADARAARDAAYALRAPGTSALSALRGQDGRIDESLAAWAKARGEATQRSDRLYSAALDLAPAPDDELVVRTELAELWFSVIDEAEAAVLSAAPEAVRFDGALQASLRQTAAESFAPVRARVTRNLDHCVRLSGDDTGPGSYFQRCQDIAIRLTAGSILTPPDAIGDTPVLASEAPRVTGSERPVEPTTRPRPCSFRGTLAVAGRVFANEEGEGPSTELRAAEPIDVDALEVPKAPGGRYKVTIRYPKAQEGWLETADGVLALRRRVDIVPDYVWAPEGLRVVPSDARGPTVHITRPGPKPAPTKGGGPSLALDRRLFCYDLTLVSALTQAPFEFAAKGNRVTLRGDAPIPLLGGPGGKIVARIPADAKPRIVESKGAFTRIIGSEPLLFEGWVKTTAIGESAP